MNEYKSKYETAVDITIEYRWDTDKLFMRAEEVSRVVHRLTGLYFNKDIQLFIRRTLWYRNRVFDSLEDNKRMEDVLDRAQKHGRTPVEYVAYLFGIKPHYVSAFFRQLGLDTPTKFECNTDVRTQSDIRKNDPKRSDRDCVVRAIAMALDMPYDNVLTELETMQGTDPTKGTFRLFWAPFLLKNGWKQIKAKMWKKQTLHTLVDNIPELSKIPMLVRVARHLFYFDANGTNIDSWDAAHSNIEDITVRAEDYSYVTNAIIGELSIEGLVHKLLKCRREYPQTTWNNIYKKIGLKWYEGQNLRRSAFFHMLVDCTEEFAWMLHGDPKSGDEVY